MLLLRAYSSFSILVGNLAERDARLQVERQCHRRELALMVDDERRQAALLDVLCGGGLTTDDEDVVNAWIDLNEAAIRAHWDGLISSAEVVRRMQRLP